uniref:Uncharacterized protein n=1 Tax=Strigamia maritima TaxID=126957 RepID=T1J8N5_STRMM
MCDIGGNIGLYFGISCLTFVEIWVYSCKMTFFSLSKSTTANSKLKTKIQTIFQRKGTQKQSQLQKRLKKIVFFFLSFISVYQVYNSIDSYFDYSVVKTVSLVRDNIIHFPLIVDCRDSAATNSYKDYLANKLNTSCLNYQLFDFLHPLSYYAKKPLAIWNDSSNFYGEYKHNDVWQKYDKRNPVMEYANLSALPTVFGICTMFKKVDLQYSRKKNFIHFRDRHFTYKNKCNLNQPNFILPQNQPFHVKHIFFIPSLIKVNIDIFRQTVIIFYQEWKMIHSKHWCHPFIITKPGTFMLNSVLRV